MINSKRRDEIIIMEDLGKVFVVHNGKLHIKIKPNLNMIGHKFGEFVLTRTIKKKKKKSQKLKKK
jgi:small subunit ribosomal protein S19